MITKLIVFLCASAVIVLLVWMLSSRNQATNGRYVLYRTYEAQPVSFAITCGRGDFSPEKRIIYSRRRLATDKVCIERVGAVRDVKPLSVVMGRSRLDGSYKVSLFFDEAASERIENIIDSGSREIALYRGDTLLTHLLIQGNGFGGEISTYQGSREEADSAMDQVALEGDRAPTQSWHR